eukprot:scaffold507664_cov59-Attheya_sp.AAC.1
MKRTRQKLAAKNKTLARLPIRALTPSKSRKGRVRDAMACCVLGLRLSPSSIHIIVVDIQY